MGALASRQSAGVEEVDIGVNHAYRYPPKSGNYFSSHFIMGGERFETALPEMYLFGENMDVNFLGSRPAPFPYPAPTANEPSKTLKALINIRKESLRFVRAPDDSATLKGPDEGSHPSRFNIEFTFDCDVRCAITIMYFCTEEVTTSGMIYTPRDPSMNSETYHYKRGANQQFSQVCHVFDPSLYPEEDLVYSFDREMLPIVIYCVAEEGEEPRQSHATFAVVEKHSDGFALKPLKQKLFVDGLSYLLQEIYGIENKNADKVSTEDDTEDNGAECVICMCDLRDTLILPCRHLCLCNCCADSLRYQASNCPICRAPFRALLQIKALQKLSGSATNAQSNTEGETQSFVVVKLMSEAEELDSLIWDWTRGGENIPPGYEAVPLIEALNGPSAAPQQPSAPNTHDLYVQLPQNATDAPAEVLPRTEASSRCFMEGLGVRTGAGTLEDSTTQTERPPSACDSTTQSVGMTEESEDLSKADAPPASSPRPPTKKKASQKHHLREKQQFGSKDSVKVVNELGGPHSLEVVDPAETRSLLDEDRLETNFGAERERRPRLAMEDMQPDLRAPQAEEEEEISCRPESAISAILAEWSSAEFDATE
ncbi:probable E3 ubiquitin-protein ligase MGRN1 isoform X3 [Scylla paramamosain]|uniref:probable E3 ubiquitin-protein ligase MGRN1 isoform X3 n=1 Tax=Scylla paramamosain TaxID=85552 RepID=UPI003083CA40